MMNRANTAFGVSLHYSSTWFFALVGQTCIKILDGMGYFADIVVGFCVTYEMDTHRRRIFFKYIIFCVVLIDVRAIVETSWPDNW